MRANQPRSAVFKGTISYLSPEANISIPVYVYKMSSDIRAAGIEFQLFHEKCHGKIRYRYFCEQCDSIVDRSEVVKMANLGDAVSDISREEVYSLLNEDGNDIRIVRPVPISDVMSMIVEGEVSIVDHYLLSSFKISDSKGKHVMPVIERQLRVILDALRRNDQALYVSTPMGGLRYGFLFPSAQLFSIRFEEEVREPVPMMFPPGEGYDKKDLTKVAGFFKSKEGKVEVPSMAGILQAASELAESRKVVSPEKRETSFPAPVVEIRGVLENEIGKVRSRKRRG